MCMYVYMDGCLDRCRKQGRRYNIDIIGDSKEKNV